jgi:iron complex transport system substrate-binding protein
VCALGLGDRLVGVSHSCDYPAAVARLPRLTRPTVPLDGLSGAEIDAAIREALREHGSVYEVDVEQLEALEPDLVLTQGICDVCAVPERQTLAALAGVPSCPSVLTLDAHDLPAILAGIGDVGRVADATASAEACVGDIERRIDRVRRRVAGLPRPRVLALEWLDPPYAPGHWVPELVRLAGGDLIAGVARRPSYRLAWEDLRSTDPDLLLLMPCGLGLAETRRAADRHQGELRQLSAPAYALDASAYFSRSGPRVVDGLEILAALLHPDEFGDVALAHRAEGWP